MNFETIIKNRRSIRHFSSKRVPDAVVQRVLDEAVWAPSAGNSQPWKVKVLDRRAIKDLIDTLEDDVLELLFPVYQQKIREWRESENPHQLKENLSLQQAFERMGEHVNITGPPSHALVVYYDKPAYWRELKKIIPAVQFRFRCKKGLSAWKYLFFMVRHARRGLKNYRLTIEASLAGFVYALTLSAFEKGIASCINGSFNLHRRTKSFLGLCKAEELFALVTLGYPAEETPGAAHRIRILESWPDPKNMKTPKTSGRP
jgi:nitroreductase